METMVENDGRARWRMIEEQLAWPRREVLDGIGGAEIFVEQRKGLEGKIQGIERRYREMKEKVAGY